MAQWNTFEILACISDNYLRLTTAHTQILQHYPPSPPQGGDGFDHYIFMAQWNTWGPGGQWFMKKPEVENLVSVSL